MQVALISKHTPVSGTTEKNLMFSNAMIYVHTKRKNTLCMWSVEFLNVKSGGTFSDDRSLTF